MPRFESVVQLPRPVAEVFDFFAQPDITYWQFQSFCDGNDHAALGSAIELCQNDSSELYRFAEELQLAAEDLPEPRDALMRASALAAGRGWILVTGSFRIVGEVRSIIRELGAQQKPISMSAA